jgi:hypothetical protein
MLRDEDAPKNVPAVLHQIVKERLESGVAVLRGEVLKRDGFVIPETDFIALYAILPVYYPDEMGACKTDGVDVVLCWLLPITDNEWRFISQRGWSDFEALLDQARFNFSKLNFTQAMEGYLDDRAAHVQPKSKRSEYDHSKRFENTLLPCPLPG